MDKPLSKSMQFLPLYLYDWPSSYEVPRNLISLSKSNILVHEKMNKKEKLLEKYFCTEWLSMWFVITKYQDRP